MYIGVSLRGPNLSGAILPDLLVDLYFLLEDIPIPILLDIQVVLILEPEPEFGSSPEIAGQTKGGIGGDRTLILVSVSLDMLYKGMPGPVIAARHVVECSYIDSFPSAVGFS